MATRGMRWNRVDRRDDASQRAAHATAIWRDRVARAEQTSRDELGRIVASAKARPCSDCGNEFPSHVMQFDHLDSETKLFNVSQWSSLFPSAEVLRAEIAKCEVVCANCHAERTHRRMVAARAARKSA